MHNERRDVETKTTNKKDEMGREGHRGVGRRGIGWWSLGVMSSMSLMGVLWMIGALGVLGGAGCSDDDSGGGESSFTCTVERDGWEQCEGDQVQYCHIVQGMDPHFHWGADCGALGFECVEVSDRAAVCVDPGSTCQVGEHRCEDNTAYNCVDQGGEGRWAVTPCGTSMHCHDEADEAVCEEEAGEECGGHGHLHDAECHCDEGYAHDGADVTTCVIHPESMCTLFGGEAHAHTVVTQFEDFPSAHADLYEPVEVEVPAGAPSYIHFPVSHDDEFVIFVDTPGAIDAVMHRDEIDVTGFHAAGANGMCETEIPEHYHVDLEMDGEQAPVPYVIRFSDGFSQATTVTFMVVDK